MLNNELVVVNVNGGFGWIYDFCTAETAAETIAEAQKFAENYPQTVTALNGDDEPEKAAKYEVMTYAEFLRRQRAAMLDGEVTEITVEKYEDMLGVLPPLHYTTINGVTMFCMCEMLTGTYTTQYAKAGGRYYMATVDAADKSTWIYNRL